MKTRHVFHAAIFLALIALPVAAASITAGTVENDGGTGAMFNVTVAANSITINSLDIFDTDPSALTVDVYEKTGTYVGSETTPAAWTLVSSTANVVGQGSTTQTVVNVTPFTLGANSTSALYIVLENAPNSNLLYGRQSSSQVVSNGAVSLTLGDGLVGLFGATSVFQNREWDGTINYTVNSVTSAPEPGSLVLLTLAAPGLWLMRRRYLRKY